jgi:hypothetical protein
MIKDWEKTITATPKNRGQAGDHMGRPYRSDPLGMGRCSAVSVWREASSDRYKYKTRNER